MKKYKIRSFSKINLSLRVLSRQNDGYHNINSIITFCNLHDVISIYKINGSNDKVSFSGRFKKGINKKSNTITKVLNLLRSNKLLKNQAFKINIQKNIENKLTGTVPIVSLKLWSLSFGQRMYILWTMKKM